MEEEEARQPRGRRRIGVGLLALSVTSSGTVIFNVGVGDDPAGCSLICAVAVLNTAALLSIVGATLACGMRWLYS